MPLSTAEEAAWAATLALKRGGKTLPPAASDVRHVIKPDSHFGKYDLRDGFWSCGVRESSRHHLMVRHPATGQLLRCTSLPFGYALSPQHFCAVTEAVADVFRRRVAGMGIHVFVFVDDFHSSSAVCAGQPRGGAHGIWSRG